jgi:predicted enzyme related to lactoylglutathione lyase
LATKEILMRLNRILAATAVAILLTAGVARQSLLPIALAQSAQTAGTANVAVGPQYDTTHVYVTPQDFDGFVASLIATFGGTTTKQGVFTVTPTPSSTMSQLVLTPVGTISVFGFKTAVPYPFGLERTGYLVTDMDEAIRAAKATGADVLVAAFNDPIGQDAIIQWPGGVNTQLYWHTTAPSYAPLQTVPENRVYVSPDRVDAFLRSFLAFSHGSVVSDEPRAPGLEIGRPIETYRRVRIESKFGKLTALVTDGHLPYPYGREITGYEVANLADTLAKAKAAGVKILVAPYTADQRDAALVQFPGGYIAEIHSPASK